MIESSEQNKFSWLIKVKNNNYRIIIVMIGYWLLINTILLSLINLFNYDWKIIIGFNLGCISSLCGFLILSKTSNWFFSKAVYKQALAFFIFLFRILLYATVIGLVIYFKFSNLFSLIAGFSLLLIAVFTNEFLSTKQRFNEKKNMKDTR
ncbi:MAG: hypothetical protein REH79_01815 [Spiroplasma sp.]|nr:hypothetical protein [Spiroplasma sp.]